MFCHRDVLNAAAKMEVQLVMLSPLEGRLMARNYCALCTCSTPPIEKCKGNLELL